MNAFTTGFALSLLAAAMIAGALQAQAPAGSLVVESPAFQNGQPIPADFTADGRNVSPAITWRNLPAGTQELALILDDPDAPTSQPFVHWVMYKIPATAKGLPEGVPAGATVSMAGISGAIQGVTGFGAMRRGGGPPPEPGYRGPAPPSGQPHRYFFKVYALGAPLDAAPGMNKDALLKAMEGKILAQGELIGTYQRQRQ